MLHTSLIILSAIVASFPLAFFLVGIFTEEEFCGLGIGILLVIALIFGPMFLSQFHTSIYLPREIYQKKQAINEAKLLLMKLKQADAGNMNIGKGLEALQLKQKITELISKKNQQLAQYKGKMVDPWIFFKPRAIPEG